MAFREAFTGRHRQALGRALRNRKNSVSNVGSVSDRVDRVFHDTITGTLAVTIPGRSNRVAVFPPNYLVAVLFSRYNVSR